MKVFIRKTIFVYLIIILFATSIIGCNKEEYATEDISNIEIETIRVWSDNAHEKELRLIQIEEFNRTIGREKGIKIEYTVYGSEYQDVIRKAAEEGTAPELFRPTGSFIMEFVENDYLIPISKLPESDDLTKAYEGQLVNNQHIFNGEVYTLPYSLTTFKFIINNDLFDKAGIETYPETWEEVRKIAQKITEVGNGKEYGWILGLQSKWMISTYLIRVNAVNVGHIGFNHEMMKFDYSAFAPAFEAVNGMINDGSVFPGYEELDADMVRAHFAEGRIGMIPAASYDTAVYHSQFPINFDWSVVSVPSFSESESQYNEFADATSLLGVGKAALLKPEKTLEVLEFFYSDENAAQMYEQSLYIPFREEAIELAESEPMHKGFTDFANVPNKVIMLPTPEDRIAIKGKPYRDTITDIFRHEEKEKDIKLILHDLDSRYNESFYQLDENIIKQYEQTEAVLESHKK